MFIPKELAVYSIKKKKNCLLLFLSITQGWGINFIDTPLILVNKFKLIFFSKAQLCFISNMFLGFFKNYFYFLKLKGMGFKMLYHFSAIIFKLGYSHRVLFIRQKEIAFTYLNRTILKVEGRSLSLIKSVLFQIMRLKKKSAYKKKGIFIYKILLIFFENRYILKTKLNGPIINF
jgi:hypothetical protein